MKRTVIGEMENANPTLPDVITGSFGLPVIYMKFIKYLHYWTENELIIVTVERTSAFIAIIEI